MGDLSAFSDADLQAELKRRKAAHKPSPAFKCDRCGEVGYFIGHFSQWRFEIQHQMFHDKHRSCPAYFGGGGI